ncbi:MAG: serine hydrolase domain-containing protein, partial [Bacteroidota bacterium]
MKYFNPILLFFICSFSMGQEQTIEPNPTHNIDGTELVNLMNQNVPKRMEELTIPGGVITIVYRDSIIYNQGFGFSNLTSEEKVDPDDTVFRVASLSKIVTTVAALQLVEQGKLALEVDINDYLDDVQLANDYNTNVTLHQLLTHTAGFDQNNMARRSLKQERVPSLKKYLSQHLPGISRRPGEVISYSNHGMALAGYLVEKTSGQQFSPYVRDHIFTPLGMFNSSFENPSAYGERLAKGYRKTNQVTTFEYLKTGPASMLMTTGKDMSAFMRMLLNEGSYKNTKILDKALISRMVSTAFRNHEFAEGRGLGFSVYDTSPKLVYHNGSFRGFNSSFYLYPEIKLGIFFSFNHKNGGMLTREIMASAHENILQLEDQPIGSMEVINTSEDFSPYIGRYQHVKNSWDNLEKLENFPSSGLRVNLSGNKGISILNEPFFPIGNSGFINNDGGRVFFKD